jgi:hypothetical protein
MSYLWLPIGSYSANRPLNAGGNRWQNPMRLAGSQALGHSFIGETSFDAQFNGDNEHYNVSVTMSKGTIYDLQRFLRYIIVVAHGCAAAVARHQTTLC